MPGTKVSAEDYLRTELYRVIIFCIGSQWRLICKGDFTNRPETVLN